MQTEGIPFVSASNIDNGSVSSKELLCLTENQYNALGAGKLKKGDIVYCIRGSLGKCGIYNFEKGAIASSLVIVRSIILNVIITNYIFLYLNSYLSESEIKKYDNGSAQPNLAAKDFMRFYLPLPPLSEQHRIVDKLNELLSFVDTIETDKTTLQDLIKQTKSKILDLAIRGKLVPQDPNDEPASVLIERVRAEKEELIRQGKIKRDKKESVIFKGEDNSYYGIDIPTDWIWATIENISCKISDGSHNPPPNSGNGIPLLSAANIYDNKVNIRSATRWITDREWISENERTQLETNDVLLTIVGSIGRTAVIDITERFALQRSVAVIKPCIVDSKYLMFILESPQISQYLIENSKGTAQKGIYLKQLSEIHIPIPPLLEQTRIVKVIETAFAQLDEISNSIA